MCKGTTQLSAFRVSAQGCLVVLACVIGLTSCSADRASQTINQTRVASCINAWNASENDKNRSTVARAAYPVAIIKPWSVTHPVERFPWATKGCMYFFEDGEVFVRFSGAWNEGKMRWGIPRTVRGRFDQIGGDVSAPRTQVDDRGLLAELG